MGRVKDEDSVIAYDQRSGIAIVRRKIGAGDTPVRKQISFISPSSTSVGGSRGFLIQHDEKLEITVPVILRIWEH
jgi:hypothetical protein